VRPAFLEINHLALQHNLQQIKKLTPNSAVIAMVKANAYGHGVAEVVPGLADADAFGIASLEEALELQTLKVKKPIILMAGFFSEDELDEIAQQEFEMVVHNHFQLEVLEKNKLPHPVNVWLKIDTGLRRLGFMPHEVKAVYQRLKNCINVNKIRLLTHFIEPDAKALTEEQLLTFNQSTADIPAERSLANSAAILAWPQTYYEWVRPGIMLYGISPFSEKIGQDHLLKPVMTLHSQLMAVQHIIKGDKVGYCGTWTSPEDMAIGIVAIGYGDGYPRHAKNGTPVLVNGKRVPLVGRVSMDMLAVDLRSQPHAKVGDPVVLWGDGLPIEIVAHHADTIAYELTCKVTDRVRNKV
jgi:alanine racemase